MLPVQIQSDYYNLDSTTNDRRFYTLYQPDLASIRGTLLIVHGMQEHSRRYQEVAMFFANQGFAVLTYDHAGHGNSVLKQEDLGFFRLKDPHELLISDADAMGQWLIKQFPNKPHFVLGHSMGSFVVRCLLQRASQEYAGAIIVGTGGALPGIAFLKSYFAFANRLNPYRHPSFNNLFGKVNNIRFSRDKDAMPTSWLSLSMKNRQAFDDDPLCGQPFTNNGYYGLFSVYQQATQKGWFTPIARELPFLLVSGQDDPIGDFGKGVRQSAADLQNHHFKSVDVRLYPNMRHEILNEDIRQEVYSDIQHWLENILK
ncbi:MAG: alpha/beta hydrolase [Chitinophagales bacterium]|nr:alpha/beta hydrolase [Chitinophagales bacterium]